MKTNAIIYVLACLLGVYSFIAVNKPAALAVALVALAVPLFGLYVGSLMAKSVKLGFELQRSCTAGQRLALAVSVERHSFWRGSIELVFECKNLITGDVQRVPVKLLPAAGKVERFDLPMNTKCCGMVAVQLASAVCYDPLGFKRNAVAHASYEASYTVYPQLLDVQAEVNRASRPDVFGGDYDRQRKGQDHSEVFDLRDFHDGDSMKQVHWKLSARFDELVVREPARPADCDIAILAGLVAGSPENENSAKVLNATLSVVASVSLSLLRQGIAHDVAHSVGQRVASATIDSREAFDEMIDTLMVTPLPHERTSEADLAFVDQWAKQRVIAKTLFIGNFIADSAFARLSESTDLSVLFVGDSSQIDAGMSGKYRISYVPAAAVDASMKSLEF